MSTLAPNENIRKLQRALMTRGYDVGKNDADGYFGHETEAALSQFQTEKQLSVTGRPDKDTVRLLFPKGETFMQKYFNGFVGSTAFKYIIAAIAGWLSKKLGLDPTEGTTTIAGAFSAAVALGMLLWGAKESATEKAVVKDPASGELVRVPLAALPPADKQVIREAATGNGK